MARKIERLLTDNKSRNTRRAERMLTDIWEDLLVEVGGYKKKLTFSNTLAEKNEGEGEDVE